MRTQVGLWIDHRHAFIVYLAVNQVTTQTVLSNLEKHVRTSGGDRSITPYGPQDIVAEDHQYRHFMQELERYYDQVTQALGNAKSIFIMGPGEAKGELKKHLQKELPLPQPAITVETTDKMTETAIMEKVKRHFHYAEEEK